MTDRMITKNMIDAGVRVYITARGLVTHEDRVTAIYEAMADARQAEAMERYRESSELANMVLIHP